MNPGYVYILINPSMPGLIKIGRTLRDASTRARELSSASGVPTPYNVALELFSEQHDVLEDMIHRELSDFRVDAKREFFRYPIAKAVALLQKLAAPSQNPATQYVAEDVTQRLRDKYPTYLRLDVATVRIVQVPGRVWLEITTEEKIAGNLVNQTIKRTDLAFIANNNAVFFRSEDNVSVNANKLVNDFDAYSIINTTDLFHAAACQELVQELKIEKQISKETLIN